MPIRHWIDKKRKLVVAEVSGSPTMEEIITTLDTAVRDPAFAPGFDILSDHSHVEHAISTEQVQGLTWHLMALSESMGKARWAVVATSPASYGMMRMLSILSEGIPITIQVFRSTPDAEEWLRQPPTSGADEDQ